MTTKITDIAPILVVKDIVRTAEYYRDILGFTINGYWFDPPVYVIISRDGSELHFGKADSEQIHANKDIRKGTPEFVVWVPDIETFFDEVKSKGADIVQKIVDREYGRECIISDCDGHQILVVQ